jgi:hypothetical protein
MVVQDVYHEPAGEGLEGPARNDMALRLTISEMKGRRKSGKTWASRVNDHPT